MVERNEISQHEVTVFRIVRESHGWLTNRQIAERVNDAKVAARTVRLHTQRLVALGIFDLAEVFPAHRYRLAEKASKRNRAYFQRLLAAEDVFFSRAKA